MGYFAVESVKWVSIGIYKFAIILTDAGMVHFQWCFMRW